MRRGRPDAQGFHTVDETTLLHGNIIDVMKLWADVKVYQIGLADLTLLNRVFQYVQSKV